MVDLKVLEIEECLNKLEGKIAKKVFTIFTFLPSRFNNKLIIRYRRRPSEPPHSGLRRG